MLRNTEFVVGVATYTGCDTKIMLNASETPSKRSRIDRIVNKSILLIFMTLLLLCTANMVSWMTWAWSPASSAWYLPERSGPLGEQGSLLWVTALILFNNLVGALPP